MSNSKSCQFCCFVRQQVFLVLMVCLFFFCWFNILAFIFADFTMIHLEISRTGEVGAIFRAIGLVLVYIGGALWSTSVVVNKIHTCSVDYR